MSQQIRVGIVGCGEVAQVIHLPALRDLADLFRVTALCDVSPSVLETVGGQWPEAGRYADYRDLVASADVDAVLVANPNVYHAEVAIAAIEAGKHVLIEKPYCVSLAEADALEAAAAKAGVTVQVGFMRRYAPAFTEAVRHLESRRGDILLARVHDVIGPNASIINSTSNVARGKDVPEALLEEGRQRMSAAAKAAVGVGEGPKFSAYNLLLGLSSHDISAMRELLGRPKAVLNATQRNGGRVITASFDYGHFVCQFETAVDQIPHFDAHVEVVTPTEILRIAYDTPYIRHLPAKLTVLKGHGTAGTSTDTSFPTRYDSFGVEWRDFHTNVTEGRTPKTSLADARADLEIFRDMIALMQ
ncbi:Gfo/Idh/MocA family protein [Kaistia adipata]|uniref:Gfo/Idh/MocA family protein n=1 Tax=Kaistia adipata TaxID=166954 RepID=UPI000415C607|nr:Gfo/Idh/MocA family oxidoreductase [Kaistia adipata]